MGWPAICSTRKTRRSDHALPAGAAKPARLSGGAQQPGDSPFPARQLSGSGDALPRSTAAYRHPAAEEQGHARKEVITDAVSIARLDRGAAQRAGHQPRRELLIRPHGPRQPAIRPVGLQLARRLMGHDALVGITAVARPRPLLHAGRVQQNISVSSRGCWPKQRQRICMAFFGFGVTGRRPSALA